MGNMLEQYLNQNGLLTKDSYMDNVKVMPITEFEKIIDLVMLSQLIILGGEFYLKDDNDNIDHAFVVLGRKYHSLDWYYIPEQNKTKLENVYSSILKAKDSISSANEIADKYKKEFYVSLIYDGNE